MNKITIKNNNAPNIVKIQFQCDDEIHNKLNDFELTKDFLNKSNTTIFIGKPGSGKTSLLINFVKKLYKKCFHHIYVFMPNHSRNSLKDNIFEKLDQSQIYDELNETTINDLYKKLKQNSDDGYRSLVIYDDVQRSLKDHTVLQSLKNIIANQRHLKVVNLILLQNYFALDKSLREIITNIIMFKMNKSQTEKIFNENIESAKDKFNDIRDIVFDKPYSWMFINPSSQRIFNSDWDEIIYNNDDNEKINI